jgi:hypothetical protein
VVGADAAAADARVCAGVGIRAEIAAAEVVEVETVVGVVAVVVGSGAGRDADADDADGADDEEAVGAGSGDVIHESLDSGEAKTTGAPTMLRAADAADTVVKDSAVEAAVASADGRGVRNDGK